MILIAITLLAYAAIWFAKKNRTIIALASLMWLYILKLNRVRVSWCEYISVIIVVIPLSVVVTLFLLYGWVQLVFVR